MLPSLARRAFWVATIAISLAGCRGLPSPNALPQASIAQAQSLGSFRGALVYAAGDQSSYVFTFPGGKRAGKIDSPGLAACSGPGGQVFFARVHSITEYRHGGTTPIDKFDVAGTAYSCSVDPTTTNLASVVFCIRRCGQEVVVIRKDGRVHSDYQVPTLTSLLYCAYDDKGDLFVDGYNGVKFGLAELRSGRSAFEKITLKTAIQFPAQIQWDGKDLAVETRENPVIYRLAIAGTTAHVVGITHLDGVGTRVTQSWIANGKIAVPTGPYRKRAIEILFWNYPAGGNPTEVIRNFVRGTHAMIDGVTFSLVPSV